MPQTKTRLVSIPRLMSLEPPRKLVPTQFDSVLVVDCWDEKDLEYQTCVKLAPMELLWGELVAFQASLAIELLVGHQGLEVHLQRLVEEALLDS